jgi:hypothetical protein
MFNGSILTSAISFCQKIPSESRNSKKIPLG